MMTVWKYSILREHGKWTFDIPNGAKIVSVAMQGRARHHRDGSLCFWAIVDERDDKVRRTFSIIGTGHKIPPFSEYVGTAFDGPVVWHLFEHQV